MQSVFISTITRESRLVWGVFLMTACVVIMWALAATFMWQLPPEIPYWYSLPPGRQQLAPVNWFWLLPVMGLTILVVNLILLRISFTLLPVYKHIVVWLGCLVQLLLTIAMVHIVMMAL